LLSIAIVAMEAVSIAKFNPIEEVIEVEEGEEEIE